LNTAWEKPGDLFQIVVITIILQISLYSPVEMRFMIRYITLFGLITLVAVKTPAQDEWRLNFPKKSERAVDLPRKEKVWIFVMAGQSNMAGRGLVEASDTIPNPRILTINKANQIILAKEPLHFYEPNLTGLDCGLSFANTLLKTVDNSITILLIPVAVGGSSSHQWLGDSVHRGVKLLSNFKNRVDSAKQYGTIKGILWHQGESDTDTSLILGYGERLEKLFSVFRTHIGNPTLPILIGELGSFSENQTNWIKINKIIHQYAEKDKNAMVISTQDILSKDDRIHFNGASQRTMGERMAKSYSEKIKAKKIR
jgi:hypothetical protein